MFQTLFSAFFSLYSLKWSRANSYIYLNLDFLQLGFHLINKDVGPTQEYWSQSRGAHNIERPARIYIFERLSRFIDWQGKGKSPCRNIIQVAYYYSKKGDEVERPLFASTKGTGRILEHDVFCSVLTYFSFPLAIQFVQTSWEAPIKIHIVTATRSSTYIARFTTSPDFV